MREFISLEKWKSANLDLVEEMKEKGQKPVILVSGASSSGKSFATEALKEYFEKQNLKCFTISTDAYNRGISHIIVDKVNQNSFEGKLKNIEQLKQVCKKEIIDLEFLDKFKKPSLVKIGQKVAKHFESKDQLSKFLNSLAKEFAKINFDESTVYDLALVAKDVNDLVQNKKIMEKEYSKKISEQQPTNVFVSGADFDVILVEGIFALDKVLVDNLKTKYISSFVEADEKTLFLRRILRDRFFAPTSFTIKNYFNTVLKAYKSEILPNKETADFVFKNDISFEENKTGEVWSVHKREKVENLSGLKSLIDKSEILSDVLFKDYYINSTDTQDKKECQLIFRVASYDKGKSFSPKSLVQKGNIKFRKDKKVIRPVNILLNEEEMKETFKNEKEFFDLISDSNFKDIDLQEKRRLRLKHNNYYITVDIIKSQGVFIELNGFERAKEEFKLFDKSFENKFQAEFKQKSAYCK